MKNEAMIYLQYSFTRITKSKEANRTNHLKLSFQIFFCKLLNSIWFRFADMGTTVTRHDTQTGYDTIPAQYCGLLTNTVTAGHAHHLNATHCLVR